MLFATNKFPGDGSTTQYEFNFAGGYLSRDHVKVYQEDVLTKSRIHVPVTPPMFLGPNTLRNLPVTPITHTLVIYRQTPATPLVDFTNNSRITENNLDTATRQGLFLAAEAFDTGGGDAIDALLEAVTIVQGLEANAVAAAVAAAASAIQAGTYRDDALFYSNSAGNSAADAITSATNAGSSASISATNATTATTKASQASTSATNAANSATAAANSATSANGASASALLSMDAAAASASTATTKADAASASATAAANSATASGNSATASGNSASAAGTSQTLAGNSATAAGSSATAASNSATFAAGYRDTALGYRNDAANSASAALTSASNANSSAGSAANEVTLATAQKTLAATEASNAAGSASTASMKAGEALSSANAANSHAITSYDWSVQAKTAALESRRQCCRLAPTGGTREVKLTRVGGTAMRIGGEIVPIPSGGASLTLNPSGTISHIFAYNNNGTVALIENATVPTFDTSIGMWTYPGIPSYIYVGSAIANAVGIPGACRSMFNGGGVVLATAVTADWVGVWNGATKALHSLTFIQIPGDTITITSHAMFINQSTGARVSDTLLHVDGTLVNRARWHLTAGYWGTATSSHTTAYSLLAAPLTRGASDTFYAIDGSGGNWTVNGDLSKLSLLIIPAQ